MDNQPIGIIDSGVGGLSVASALIKNLPNESVIYLADSKNCPYGTKPNSEIYKLTKKMVAFLLTKNIKLLIVACNTITVTSISKLRQEFPNLPIVGIVPVIKKVAEVSKNGKIGVFSTKVTAKSQYQKDLIKKFAKGYKVVNVGAIDLVPLIEELDFKAIDKVLEKELQIFKEKDVDALALGCSHFPLIKEKIAEALPNVLILDSGGAVYRQVKRILEANQILSKLEKSNYNFYTTGNLEAVRYFVKKLTIKGKVERISLR